MASFLCAIISSKDNPIFVLHALQLVELLAMKLPDVYQVSFQREGVVFEIEALAEQEPAAAKASSSDGAVVKTEPEEVGQATPTPAAGPSSGLPILRNIPDDLKPLFAPGGISGGLSSFLAESGMLMGTSSPRRPMSTIDPNDANISRARVLLAKKIFNADGDDKDAASLVLEKLSALVKKLCAPEASEAVLRDALREIAEKFSDVGQALSSFELLKSGLVDGLLDFVDVEGTISSTDRRGLLFDVFADKAGASSSPLSMLVKRLHESLGRLENYEVETAFNGVADSGRPSSSSLSRTIRVRLQAEEGQDVPKQVANISLTIQAIAPMQALHDYLRPRVADANYMSTNGMSGMFAAYAAGMAIPKGGSGTGSASRFLAVLSANRPGGSGVPALGTPIASSAPESSRLVPLEPTAGASGSGRLTSSQPQPQRRRSARISGQGIQGAESQEDAELPTMEGVNDDGAGGMEAQLSSSAPEPSILPPMPMDMDFDDEDGYTDEEYDAEVSTGLIGNQSLG
jgi:E3 ubiquitin-protein ligase TRIP12